MANKTIADRIVAAKDTGEEAKFYSTDATSSGTAYEFTPAGIADYLVTEEGFNTSTLSQGAAVADLTDDTGVTADDTVENIPAATAADTDTSAASLASTNAAITAIENNIGDLTDKLNALLASLRAANIIDT